MSLRIGYVTQYTVYRPSLHTGEDERFDYAALITYRNNDFHFARLWSGLLLFAALVGARPVLPAAAPAQQARASGLSGATNPTRHTGYADQPFEFSFPNLKGRLVSSTDPRFRGKVLLVDIAGSWCPSCHDEAPFLESLYKKYRARGLEIVTLAFEDPAQFANPERLRAFVRQFGLTYTVLLAGTTDELHAKLPQAVGLYAYPTTFFIGRDGYVRAVHPGFASPAAGSFNTQLKREFTRRIEQLLASRR